MNPPAQMEVVLNFHGIGKPPEGIPATETPYWVSELFFRDIIEMAQSVETENRISVTFDDGNLSDLDIAMPILRDNSLSGSFFVLTGRLNKAGYLGSDHLTRLLDAGMTIGLHGRDHVDWRKLDPDGLGEETEMSRDILQQAAGVKIDSVGIPFGAYNRNVIAVLKHQGFAKIFTSDGGITNTAARIKERNTIRCDMTVDGVRDIILGNETTKNRLRRRASCLVRRYVL